MSLCTSFFHVSFSIQLHTTRLREIRDLDDRVELRWTCVTVSQLWMLGAKSGRTIRCALLRVVYYRGNCITSRGTFRPVEGVNDIKTGDDFLLRMPGVHGCITDDL